MYLPLALEVYTRLFIDSLGLMVVANIMKIFPISSHLTFWVW